MSKCPNSQFQQGFELELERSDWRLSFRTYRSSLLNQALERSGFEQDSTPYPHGGQPSIPYVPSKCPVAQASQFCGLPKSYR